MPLSAALPMVPLDPAFLARPIAHRALHDKAHRRPENSRAAIRAAIARGYGIEIDLQLSLDGEAMVFHDSELSRLTREHGPIGQRTTDELTGIALRHSNGETIPTLPEILSLIGGRVPLMIEIKDQDGAMGANVGPLELATADALIDYPGPVACMSFNPHSVAMIGQLSPDIARGLITCGYTAEDWPDLPATTRVHLRKIADYTTLGASFVSHNANNLHNPRLQELRDLGAVILTWTVTSRNQGARALLWADNITFENYLA
ncbi:glycerophosphodiester phosphodiesterase family protein [Aquicoccus sp. G2-2]|uniref:glycerophosphodiester phosphodiesterase family protein n=1 Tax=Aquicoccus sp. G2-2 TaxID=3092120 RepID=UPI002AE09B20|nr:glycerophosphodiester phosphodiesterase family protein [Aquicoccus sp. G2-2]MEA1115123.1 glycerophosphodiester phosphodiesterase family protein [Aquicoccus sp. G2-2]